MDCQQQVCHEYLQSKKSRVRELVVRNHDWDVISLLLFIVSMDECMRNIGVGGHHKETLAHGDDMVVVADSITYLQEIIKKWYQ